MATSILLSILGVFSTLLPSALAGTPVFDELIYTQQWAPAACLQVALQKEHKCVIPTNVSTWTVHGIWPTEGGSYGPNYCNKTDKFDLSKLTPIMDQLLKFWPNLFTDEKPEQFWEHEWTKHGTCAEIVPSLNSELKYFSMGLKLNRHFDLLKSFETSGIVPHATNAYKLSDISKSLTLALGYKPKIQCFLSKDKSHQTLIQIEMCMDKTFAPIECKKKKGKSDKLYYKAQTGKQVKKRSYGSVPARTQTCEDNLPILYLPFQR